jgi:hypothetical protein
MKTKNIVLILAAAFFLSACGSTSGQGTTKQATHVNDFVGALFGGNAPTGGKPNAGALPAHSSYTEELTTSDKDTGAALPKDGLLVIVGEPAKFADTANFARDRGLTVDVLPPVEKDGSPPIIDEPLTVAPSKEQSVNLQEQVQRDSNTQMNQLLRSGSRK